MTLHEFEQRYWYKKELMELCRTYGISTTGTKADLVAKIKEYLKTGSVKKDTRYSTNIQKRRAKKNNKPLSLRTRIIPEGVSFDQKTRDFLSRHFGVKRFGFTKEMAQAVRDAEKRGDMEMTLADLIEVYVITQKLKKTGKLPQSADDKSYQWNQFVKDFCTDPATRSASPVTPRNIAKSSSMIIFLQSNQEKINASILKA